MTIAQEKTVAAIRRYIENDFYDDNYEFKQWEVTAHEWGKVEVYAVTGRKNDDNTMASVLCRTYRQIFIGKNGGVVADGRNPVTKKTRRYTGWQDVMIFGTSS